MNGLRVAAAFALFFATTPGGSAETRVEDPSRWTRLEAGPIVVLTDAGGRRASAVAREIAAFRGVLERTTRSLEVSTDRRTVVYLFRDSRSMAPFQTPGIAEFRRGWFFRHGEMNHVIVNATPQRNIEITRANRMFAFPNRELFHEWTHVVLEETFPELPTWAGEGVAEYFSTFWIDGRYAEVGRAPVHRAFGAVVDDPLPMSLLLRVRDTARELPDEEAIDRFYSQSWAIVHYLLRGSETRKKEFGRFLGALKDGNPQGEAWRASFSAPPEQILRETLAYLKPRHFTFVRYDVGELAPVEPSAPQPVAPADLLVELGRLALLSRRDRPEEAGARFEAALAIDPRHVRALEGLAEVRYAQGRKDEAERLLREAERGGPPAAAR